MNMKMKTGRHKRKVARRLGLPMPSKPRYRGPKRAGGRPRPVAQPQRREEQRPAEEPGGQA